MGVSTSRYPTSFIFLRIESIIFVRLIKISLVELFVIKSRYLCLYLASISVKPLNFSGIGLKDFVIISRSHTSIVNSSVFVLNKEPETPTMSPRSQVLKSS